MSLQFPGRLSLATLPTPLVPLRRISAEIGGPLIWLKRDDLTGSTLGGNKVRKLEFSLAAAIDQGCDTIITMGGVQSNHCRATALLCAQLGLHCHLLLFGQEKPADGNLLLDKLAGARISFYPASDDPREKEKKLEEWRRHHLDNGTKPFTIPTGASDATGLWGYIAAAQELQDDFSRQEIHPGHIVTATGSGGTQAGLILGNQLFELGSVVWGVNVDHDAQYFVNKIRNDMGDWKQLYDQPLDTENLDINIIEGYLGKGYGIASAKVFETIRHLAKTEGIVLDPVYTGKAFYGMLEQIKLGRFGDASDIVFIHTGGIFGLFPQRDQLFETDP